MMRHLERDCLHRALVAAKRTEDKLRQMSTSVYSVKLRQQLLGLSKDLREVGGEIDLILASGLDPTKDICPLCKRS